MDHDSETNNRAHAPCMSEARPNMYKCQLPSTELPVTCFFRIVEALCRYEGADTESGVYRITPFTMTRAPWGVHDVDCNRWSYSEPAVLGNVRTGNTLGSAHNYVASMGWIWTLLKLVQEDKCYYTRTPVLRSEERRV